ncbi:MAG: InlB B-repeat-containing protein [bacterium]
MAMVTALVMVFDTNNYEEGDTVTVKAVGNLVRTGYSFTGWNTTDDGSGTNYLPGNTFQMGSANIILYAKWTNDPTYTVSYNGNASTGGTAPVDANNYQQSDTVTVKAVGNLVRTTYSFTGWNTAQDGSGTSYSPADTFQIAAANVVLYAQWTSNPTYTVTYNGNSNTGGAAPVDANNYQQSDTVTVKAVGNLVRTAYSFTGWNTAQDGSGTSYSPADTFQIAAANVVLYAQWTSNPTYTVTYNGNSNSGGTAPVDANNYQQSETVTVQAVGSLVRTGYTFANWNTAQNGSGTSYSPAATFVMGSANVTLYAQWQAVVPQTETFKINFGALNSTFGGTVAGWNNNSMDTVPSNPLERSVLDINGVDSGIKISVPASSASTSKKLPATTATSVNADFPTAVMTNAIKGYSAFVTTGVKNVMDITGLVVGHNYTFKILSAVNTAATTYTISNAGTTNISVVGSTTVSGSVNSFDNDGTTIMQATVQPTAEGKIFIQYSTTNNWNHCFINAMIITKD